MYSATGKALRWPVWYWQARAVTEETCAAQNPSQIKEELA
jgi:hypothetical protein